MTSSLLQRRHVLTGSFALLALGACKDKTPQKPYYQGPETPKLEPAARHTLFEGLMQGDAPFVDPNPHSFKLVYFGTAHKIESCTIDLTVLSEAAARLKSSCAGRNVEITPVFIYPDPQPADAPPLNLTNTIDVPGSTFTALHASQNVIEEVAAKFGAMYVLNPDASVKAHTRYSYLMSPAGENLFTFRNETYPDDMVEEGLKAMKCEAAPSPGL